MKKRQMCRGMMVYAIFLCAVLMGSISTFSQAQWPTIELPERDPIGSITTYPEDYLDWMDNERRTAASVSIMALYPEVVKRGRFYDDMLQKEGPAALARAMVEAYPTDKAWLELAAGAVAMAARTGYMGYSFKSLIAGDDQLGIPKEIQKQMVKERRKTMPEQLVKQVHPVIDEILKIDSPYARDVAAEMLLQVFSETLGSGHCESHNGRREIEPIPKELTARAAAMLGADDPFTDAVAEWAVSTNVCNEIETEQGKLWLNEEKPDWWDAWVGRDGAKDLQIDYIRQAIQLQMHRRGQDLLTLSNGQKRRAEEKARWIKGQLPQEKHGEIDTLVNKMKSEHKKFADTVAQNGSDLTACRRAFLDWRPTVRDVVMSGPDVDFDSVVFATQVPGGNHGQPSSQNAWEGRAGDLFVQKGLKPGSPKKALIGDKMPPRLVGDIDLWFDGDKAIFCAAIGDRRAKWQLYEIDLEGEKLTKLPGTGERNDDHNCAYLPDGGIVFASTAANTAVMCMGGANTYQSDIFIMNADRSETHRLTFSKDDDDYPYVMNDGMVVWMRWDYQERGVDEIFSLWKIRPDGSGSDAFYRSHIPKDVIIQTLRDPVPVPDSEKFVAVGASHRTGVEGHLILADPAMGMNNPLGIRTVTPYTSPMTYGFGRLMRPVEEGGVPYPGGMVCTPQALTDKTFLASISHDMPESNFWLYYVDAWGNKELIHRDKTLATVCAFAVEQRKKPVQMPKMTDPSKNYAMCYVENVYADLPGVEKGEVKHLRILKNMGWPIGYQFHPQVNPNEVFGIPGTGGPVQVIGTVPVEEDGSAYFEAPAAMDIYLQALDNNYIAVQRMRTHFELGRGENRSCLGCHETRDDVSLTNTRTLALGKTAVRPTPPPWGDTTIMNYETMIQPIFEKKCVSCHGAEEPKGGLDLSANKDEDGFMQSYRSMWGLKPGAKAPEMGKMLTGKWGKYHSDHPWWKIMEDRVNIRDSLKEDAAIPNPVKKYGAIAHPLVKKVTGEGKHGEMLTDEEKQYLMTWFDIQAPYFDYFYAWDEPQKHKRLKPYPPFGDSREYIVEK